MRLTATAVRVVFSNDENDYRVIAARDASGKPVTIVGEFPSPRLGVTYEVTGDWTESTKYGPQFKAESFRFVRPIAKSEMKSFMSRVGKITAGAFEKAWKRFGEDTLSVFASGQSNAELSELVSIPKPRVSEWSLNLRQFLGHEQVVAEICHLVEGCQIPQTAIIEAAEQWGGLAGQRIKQNPWRLLRLPGVGFRRADAVYRKHGGDPRKLKRQCIAIAFAIDQSESTWLTVKSAMSAAASLLEGVVPTPLAIRLGVRSGLLLVDGEYMTLKSRYLQEKSIAKKIREINATGQISLTMESSDVLSPHQLEELGKATSKRVGVLRGGPGTGKTFAAAEFIRNALRHIDPTRVAILAPTGKAAVRLTEVMSNAGLAVGARTIHSFVGVRHIRKDGEIELDDSTVRDYSLVVVDESSMIPVKLMHALLRSLTTSCRILFIGDTGQLPPIGHGAPLRDMVISDHVPVGTLTEVRRNSGAIVRLCSAIADSRPYDPPASVREKIGNNCVACGGIARCDCQFRSSRRLVASTGA